MQKYSSNAKDDALALFKLYIICALPINGQSIFTVDEDGMYFLYKAILKEAKFRAVHLDLLPPNGLFDDTRISDMFTKANNQILFERAISKNKPKFLLTEEEVVKLNTIIQKWRDEDEHNSRFITRARLIEDKNDELKREAKKTEAKAQAKVQKAEERRPDA